MNNLIGRLIEPIAATPMLDAVCLEMSLMIDEGPFEQRFERVVLFADADRTIELPEVGHEVEIIDPVRIQLGGRSAWLGGADCRVIAEPTL